MSHSIHTFFSLSCLFLCFCNYFNVAAIYTAAKFLSDSSSSRYRCLRFSRTCQCIYLVRWGRISDTAVPLRLAGGKINGSNPGLTLVCAQGKGVELEGKKRPGKVPPFYQALSGRGTRKGNGKRSAGVARSLGQAPPQGAGSGR